MNLNQAVLLSNSLNRPVLFNSDHSLHKFRVALLILLSADVRLSALLRRKSQLVRVLTYLLERLFTNASTSFKVVSVDR